MPGARGVVPRSSLSGPDERHDDEVAALLTPSEVQRLLRAHGLAPRKAAGQNFVVDPNTVRRIVAAADLAADDVVLEVGPGLGSLTLGLAAAVHRVVAVEIDAGMVAALGSVLADRKVGNVEVVHADALRADLDALVDGGLVRLVANLPYNTATPIVMRALATSAVTDLFVMVQREVGERWCARPGDPLHAGVSVKLALQADAEVALTVPRTVFHPVPNVDSVMVRIRRRPDAPVGDRRARLLALVDAAFAQRRKTLRNTLRDHVSADVLAAAADRAGIDLGARAETLDADAVTRLGDALTGLA
jgi:16S rRNA (adenine1518-N6/adenine1519-N6)-dimethyltransferase